MSYGIVTFVSGVLQAQASRALGAGGIVGVVIGVCIFAVAAAVAGFLVRHKLTVLLL